MVTVMAGSFGFVLAEASLAASAFLEATSHCASLDAITLEVIETRKLSR